MAKNYIALNKEEEIMVEDSQKTIVILQYLIYDIQQIWDFSENTLDKPVFLLYNKLVAKKKRADLIEISTLDGSCEPYLIVTN